MFYAIFCIIISKTIISLLLQKMDAKAAKLSVFLDDIYQFHKEINWICLNI